MSEENTFAPSEAPAQPESPENFLEALVGEGKKYASVDELAKGAYNAQQHIAKLEQERKAVNPLEEMLTKLDERLQQAPTTAPAPLEPKPVEATTSPSEPKSVDLEEMIRKVVDEDRQVQSKTQNYKQAVTALDKYFGSRTATNEAVERRARELETPVSLLKEAAETNPKAFFALMGIDGTNSTKKEKTPTGAPAPRGVNTLSILSQQSASDPKPGTRAWYKKLQKEDLKKYRTPAIQRQMFDDLERDPEYFKNG